MKSMSKTAKTLDTILKILFYLCAAMGAVLAAASVVFLFAGETLFSDSMTSITLDSFTFQLADGYVPEGTVKAHMLLGSALGVAAISLACYTLKVIRKILAPMIQGQPFDTAVSAHLKRLSFIVLIGGGVISVCEAAAKALMFGAYDMANLFLNDSIAAVSLENRLNGSFIAAFGVLYLLSCIFRYGEELQTLSDETL